MAKTSPIESVGTESSKIGVLLSYKLVKLFSEGLYTTPIKAIEELVGQLVRRWGLASGGAFVGRFQSARLNNCRDG